MSKLDELRKERGYVKPNAPFKSIAAEEETKLFQKNMDARKVERDKRKAELDAEKNAQAKKDAELKDQDRADRVNAVRDAARGDASEHKINLITDKNHEQAVKGAGTDKQNYSLKNGELPYTFLGSDDNKRNDFNKQKGQLRHYASNRGIQIKQKQDAIKASGISVDDFNGAIAPVNEKFDAQLEDIRAFSEKKDGILYETRKSFVQQNLQEMIANEYTRKMYDLPNRVDELEQFLKNNPEMDPANQYDKTFMQEIGSGFGQMASQLYGGFKQGIGRAGAFATTGATVGAISGNATGIGIALPEEVITIPAGIVIGASFGMATGYSDYMKRMEGGMEYRDMIQQGISPGIAANTSSLIGNLNAAIELAEVATLAFGKVPKILGLDAIKEKGNKILTNKLVSLATAYGLNVGTQVVEELVQENASMAITEVSKMIDDPDGVKFARLTGAEFISTQLQVAKQTFFATAIFSGVGVGSRAIITRQTEVYAKETLPNIVASVESDPASLTEATAAELVEIKAIINSPDFKNNSSEEVKKVNAESTAKIDAVIAGNQAAAKTNNDKIVYKAANVEEVEAQFTAKDFTTSKLDTVFNPNLSDLAIESYKEASEYGVLDTVKTMLDEGKSKFEITQAIKKKVPSKNRSSQSLYTMVNRIEVVSNEVKAQAYYNAMVNTNIASKNKTSPDANVTVSKASQDIASKTVETKNLNVNAAYTIDNEEVQPTTYAYQNEAGDLYALNNTNFLESDKTPVKTIQAADGVSAKAAMVIENAKNEIGDAVDVAIAIKKGADGTGNSKLLNMANSLVKLDDAVFNQVVAKLLPLEKAIAIAEKVTSKEAQMQVASELSTLIASGKKITNKTFNKMLSLANETNDVFSMKEKAELLTYAETQIEKRESLKKTKNQLKKVLQSAGNKNTKVGALTNKYAEKLKKNNSKEIMNQYLEEVMSLKKEGLAKASNIPVKYLEMDPISVNQTSQFDDTLAIAKESPVFNGVQVEIMSETSKRYFTKEELNEIGYNNLEAGEYEITGYKTSEIGESQRIVLNKGASQDTIAEELIHVFQDRVAEIDPVLAFDIAEWESEVIKEAANISLEIPKGKELFAKAMVFSEMGWANEEPMLARIFSVPDDIINRVSELIGDGLFDALKGAYGVTATKLIGDFDKYSEAKISTLLKQGTGLNIVLFRNDGTMIKDQKTLAKAFKEILNGSTDYSYNKGMVERTLVYLKSDPKAIRNILGDYGNSDETIEKFDNTVLTMQERNWKELGDEKINAYQFDYPEVKPFYAKIAKELLIDINNSQPGGAVYNWDAGILDKVNVPRATSETMAQILDETGKTYDAIRKALNALIEGGGKENNATSKRIEVIIDEKLVEGYKMIYGEDVPPNDAYIQLRNRIEPYKIKNKFEPEILENQLNEQMTFGTQDEDENFSMFDFQLKSDEKYWGIYPAVRGALTKDKIAKRLKEYGYAKVTERFPSRVLSEFNSAEQAYENIYYHGSPRGGINALRPSISLNLKEDEMGGGYGDKYFAISVSKSKDKASNFTSNARYGSVYPVLLKKGANVIEMPEIQDSIELDDIIVDLWERKVDAVKIGDWNNPSSEQELAIINPRAISVMRSQSFPVYQKQKFENMTLDEFRPAYDYAIEFMKAEKAKSSEKSDPLTSYQIKPANFTREEFKTWFGDSKAVFNQDNATGLILQNNKLIVSQYQHLDKNSSFDYYDFNGEETTMKETLVMLVGEEAANTLLTKGVYQGEFSLPMEMYHGTPIGGYEAFDYDKTNPYGLFGGGFYFTDDEGIAKTYVKTDRGTSDPIITLTIGNENVTLEQNADKKSTSVSETAMTKLYDSFKTPIENYYTEKLSNVKIGDVVHTVDRANYELALDHMEYLIDKNSLDYKIIYKIYETQEFDVLQRLNTITSSYSNSFDSLQEMLDSYIGNYEIYGKVRGKYVKINQTKLQLFYENLEIDSYFDEYKKYLKSVGLDFKVKMLGPTIYKTNLSIQNPIDADVAMPDDKMRGFVDYILDRNASMFTTDEFIESFKEKMIDNPYFIDKPIDLHSLASLMKYLDRKIDHNFIEDVPAALQSIGYDGLTHMGGIVQGGRKHRVFIAWEPTQIKSIENTGVYSKTNTNINYQIKGAYKEPGWTPGITMQELINKHPESVVMQGQQDNLSFLPQDLRDQKVLSMIKGMEYGDEVNIEASMATGVKDLISVGENEFVTKDFNEYFKPFKIRELTNYVQTLVGPEYKVTKNANSEMGVTVKSIKLTVKDQAFSVKGTPMLAMHNLTEAKLKKLFKYDGIPVPSIAIVNRNMPLENFGDITLVGTKDMIDPKNSTKNKIFNADVYSPRFPKVSYKIFFDEIRKDFPSLYEISSGLWDGSYLERSLEGLDPDKLHKLGNTPHGRLLFLHSKGVKVEPVYRTKLMQWRDFAKEPLKSFLIENGYKFDSQLDLETLIEFESKYREVIMNELPTDEFIDVVMKPIKSKFIDKAMEFIISNDRAKLSNLINGNNIKTGIDEAIEMKQEIDRYATEERILNEVANFPMGEFSKWFSDTFSSYYGNARIMRPNAEFFYPSDDRKPDSEVYMPATVENVLFAMQGDIRAQEYSSNGRSPGELRALATKQFRSIKDMKEHGSMLVDNATMETVKQKLDDFAAELFSELSKLHSKYGGRYFNSYDKATELAGEFFSKGPKTIERALRLMKEHGFAENESLAKDLIQYGRELENAPTEYFEAKPQRIVKFDEFGVAIVPEDTSDETIQGLKNVGILDIRKYDNEDGRKAILANLDSMTFQLKPADTKSDAFKNWFDGSKVVDKNGEPLVVYHGTDITFEEFESKKAGMGNDSGMRGRGFYFSPNEKTSSSYGSNVIPLYLSIKNPFNPMDFKSKEEIAELLGIDKDIFEYNPGENFKVYQSYSGTFSSALKDSGYDGVIYLERQEVVAFYPEQIKSVYNKGDFNPNDPRMYYQLKGKDQPTFIGKLDTFTFFDGQELNVSKWKKTVETSINTSPEVKAVLMDFDFITKVKKNASTLLEAADFIGQNGIDGAEAFILDPTTPDNEVTFVASMILQEIFEQQGKVDKVVDLIVSTSEKATTFGRIIQSLSMYNRLTPQGAFRLAAKTIQKTLTPKDIADTNAKHKEVMDKLGKENEKVVDGVEIDEEMKKIKELTPEEMLFRRISNTLSEKHNGKSPLQAMIDTLFAVAKESPLPNSKSVTDPMSVVVEAIKNRAEYREVWEKAKALVAEQFKDNPSAMIDLEEYFDKAINRTFQDSKLKKAIGNELKEMNVKIRDIVKQHYSANSKLRTSLVEKLVADSGLTEDEAMILEQHIRRQMKDMTKQAKESILKTMFKEKTTVERKSISDRIIELSNLGAMNNNNFKGMVAAKLGLPGLTDEAIATLDAQARDIQLFEDGSRQQIIAIAKMLDTIAAYIPANKAQKIALFQTMMQLLNPKTVGRNIVGNAGFSTLEYISDNVGVPIDALIRVFSKIQTKKFNPLGKLIIQKDAYIEGFKLGLEDALLGIDTSGVKTQFELPKTKVFRKGPLSTMETVMSIALRATDRAAYMAAFQDAMQEQLAISGLSEPTSEMIEIAHALGLYRTFQDTNALSDAFVKTKQALNTFSSYVTGTTDFGLGDFVLKYPKTPANILARGLDYSPIGLIVTAVQLFSDVSGNKYLRQKIAVDGISRALVGSALIGIGAKLFELGVLTGSRDKEEDKDVYAVKLDAGFKNFAVNITAIKRLINSGFDPKEGGLRDGDSLMTYDWFQPTSIGIAIGADIAANGGNATSLSTKIILAMEAGSTTLAEQPLLTGIAKLFKGETVVEGFSDVIKGVPASFIPTFLSQIKMFLDDTRYSTYDPANYVASSMNLVYNKIPGVAGKMLAPAVESFGEISNYYPDDIGLTSRIFNTFLNPAIVSKYETTEEMDLIFGLMARGEGVTQFPRYIPYDFIITDDDGNKQKVTLNPQQYSEIKQFAGTKIKEAYQNEIRNGIMRLDDESQVDILYDILGDIGKEVKAKVQDMYE